MKKSWKFQGVGGSNAKPPGMENPVGWGVKLEKTLRGGGMDIFWNHTIHQGVHLENADCALYLYGRASEVNQRETVTS